MTTHCSILAWKIPWAEEPGGYGSWGCKESDSTEKHAHTEVHLSEGLKGVLGGGLVCRGSTLAGPHRLLRLLSNEELNWALPCSLMGFPHDSDGKESAYNAEDPDLIPGSGRSPGE